MFSDSLIVPKLVRNLFVLDQKTVRFQHKRLRPPMGINMPCRDEVKKIPFQPLVVALIYIFNISLENWYFLKGK